MNTPPPSVSPDRLFEAALDLPIEEREAFLVAACGGNDALLAEVRALLTAHEAIPTGFLASPVAGEVPAGHFDPTIDALDSNRSSGKAAGPVAGSEIHPNPRTSSERSGDLIGPYKLREQIGEGGFGTVWVADQDKPVKRRVALKIVKLGMDTNEVIARFEQERQALAMMDHSNIAKIFDAGSTESGRLFFVMELVKGKPITQYCDDAGLGTHERLELFGDVCSAINHAHQKGVIHRDIKPSNVMVTLHGEKPVVKVIDFGIAKATQGKLTDKTLFTRLEQFIGTPVYMSPEQASLSGLDIDTRSDIYALGIMLYELLVGKPPFDVKSLASAGYEEMRRIIREVEPVKPSSRISTMAGEERTQLAKARHIEPEKLHRLVESDLDWIVMKAIEKDRTRRYETANAFAQDIRRFLADEPVSASPPSAGYLLRKFARRHKATLRVATAMIAVLVAATVVSTWQAIRATRAEKQTAETLEQVAAERDAKENARQAAKTAQQKAEIALQEAEAISTFLAEVFQSPDPNRDGRDITVAETLDRAAAKLETDLTAQPARRANLRATLGRTYYSLSLFSEAIPLLERSRDYFLATLGSEHPDTLQTKTSLGCAYDQIGRRQEALELREHVLSLYSKVHGPEHPDTITAMDFLAVSYSYCQREVEAVKLHEEVLALSQKVKGPEHPDTLTAMHGLGISHLIAITHKKHESPTAREDATKIHEKVLALSREIKGPEHSDTITAMLSLSYCYYTYGDRRAEALAMREEVLALRRKILGPVHADTLRAMAYLSHSLAAAGRKDEVITLLEELVGHRRNLQGPLHQETLAAINSLALAFSNAGRLDDALKVREEVRKIREEALKDRRKAFGVETFIHPERASTTEPNLIDLSRHHNAFLADEWQAHLGNGNDLMELPTGRQIFAGVAWDVRGIIQLSSQRMPQATPPYPDKVEGISIGQQARRLHFLHSAGYATDLTNETIGSYVIHFADGGVETQPIVVGKDVLDWWAKPAGGAAEPVVAWSGLNLLSRSLGRSIQIFKTTWQNPRPATEITSVDFISEMKNGAPFLIAITADPLKTSSRTSDRQIDEPDGAPPH